MPASITDPGRPVWQVSDTAARAPDARRPTSTSGQPAAHGDVIYFDAPLGEQLLDIAVEPDCHSGSTSLLGNEAQACVY